MIATSHPHQRRDALRWLAAAAVACAAATPAAAQTAEKSVVPEAVAAVPAFNQWVNSVVVAVPESVPASTISTLPLTVATAPATTVPYEPWPVIIGVPDLPLIGSGAGQPSRPWQSTFNYQGLHMKLLVLDASGRRIEARPVSALPRPGERFKVRVTATFEAVADVGLVVGEAFASQRAGQLYPAVGMSVHMHAGETVDLPLDKDQYFVMGRAASERLLLSVRHAQATGDARTNQPAYRQDGRNGSGYLQLVPQGSHPAIEQIVSLAR